MFCTEADLVTESDVEQKLIWQLLTTPTPRGLGFSVTDIWTKPNIRRLEIGKGASRHVYYPDYVVVLAGLPVLVIEAKKPGEDLDAALEEGRLYATEINALFPAGINPCIRILAVNGTHLASSPWDHIQPDQSITLQDLDISNIKYATFVDALSRAALQTAADAALARISRRPLARPTSKLGGQSVRNEEIGHNTFGASITLEYGHLFNPRNQSDRAYVVKNAYVQSKRRERYVDPIDRLIRGATPPIVSHIPAIEDSSNPREVVKTLSKGKELEHHVLLLVGSVGSGKSTFVDYLREVALPREVLSRTVWARMNMNDAPLKENLAYEWITEQLISSLKSNQGNADFDSLAMLEKVYGVELARFRKGPVKLFAPESNEYRTRLADRILELVKDRVLTAQALSRFLCGQTGKLLVIVLDNCDKRIRDEQLLMFQVAQWMRATFKGLVILPLRDVTYDLHKDEPPLDTALKDLVFRIEPPIFSEVLARRIKLVLARMIDTGHEKSISYDVPNGMRVTYPASDQGMYLSCILRSLFDYDKFVRRIMSGLAGRDIRRAMEIFLEFCGSGHISESEIFKIRMLSGQYTLPFNTVARVLLRVNRRFYDGDKSHLKNLFQCHPKDSYPDHMVRVAILRWLDLRLKVKGPTGVAGFHRCETLVSKLVPLGHDAIRIREEVAYLLKNRCLIAEHQRTDTISDDDLICLSPSGSVHLTMLSNVDYLAACAEDIWYDDQNLAQRVADRIGNRGARWHYSRGTLLANAKDLTNYISSRIAKPTALPNVFLNDEAVENLHSLDELHNTVAGANAPSHGLAGGRLFVGNLAYDISSEIIRTAFVAAGFDVKDIRLPRHPETGRLRGFGFVTLGSAEQAARAFEKMSGIMLGGRPLNVEEADDWTTEDQPNQPTGLPVRSATTSEVGSLRMYVGNLPFDATQEMIRAVFKERGLKLTDIALIPSTRVGEDKCYGFVSVDTASSIDEIITLMRGSRIADRPVQFRPATERSKLRPQFRGGFRG